MPSNTRKTRPFTTARSYVFVGFAALTGVVACDKLAPRENVSPLAAGPGSIGSGGGALDAGGGGGFVPRGDAGGVGRDAGSVSSDGGDEPESDGEVAGDDAAVPEPRPDCGPLPADGAFSRAALLASVAQCTTHYYCQFDIDAERFARAARAYADRPSDDARADAQEAWYVATRAWEVAELFEFGPGAPAMDPGGRDLRDQIDSFPLVSRCSVEEVLANAAYSAEQLDTSSVNTRGLSAIEYALFFTGTNNACSQFSPVNSQGLWSAMSADELAERKVAYAAAAAELVARRSKTLLEAWSPEGEDFSAQLASPGSSSVYANEQAALNAVSNALFFVDKELKDSKVAIPGGLMSCTQNCANLAESPYARVGKDFIADNLRGFRLIFQGCGEEFAGIGFDDWLRSVGRGDIADDMLEGLDNADRALAEIDRIEDAFVNDPAKIMALHAAIKTLTDILKVDFLTVLNLERPMSSEGDND